MEPKDVYVVFNNVSNAILSVWPFDWMAEKEAEERYWTSNSVTGTVPNTQKIDVLPLSVAIRTISEEVYFKS